MRVSAQISLARHIDDGKKTRQRFTALAHTIKRGGKRQPHDVHVCMCALKHACTNAHAHMCACFITSVHLLQSCIHRAGAQASKEEKRAHSLVPSFINSLGMGGGANGSLLRSLGPCACTRCCAIGMDQVPSGMGEERSSFHCDVKGFYEAENSGRSTRFWLSEASTQLEISSAYQAQYLEIMNCTAG